MADDDGFDLEKAILPRGFSGGQVYPWNEIEHEGGAVLVPDQWSAAANFDIDHAEKLLDSAWRSREKRMEQDWTYHVGRIRGGNALYIFRHSGDIECEPSMVKCRNGFSEELVAKIKARLLEVHGSKR